MVWGKKKVTTVLSNVEGAKQLHTMRLAKPLGVRQLFLEHEKQSVVAHCLEQVTAVR